MKIQQLGIERALASLNSGPDGLSAFEAQRRLREFGPNRVEAVAQESLGLRFAREFIHFFAVILCPTNDNSRPTTRVSMPRRNLMTKRFVFMRWRFEGMRRQPTE